jgi:hypothetical protein
MVNKYKIWKKNRYRFNNLNDLFYAATHKNKYKNTIQTLKFSKRQKKIWTGQIKLYCDYIKFVLEYI